MPAKILILDDSPTMRELLKRYLRNLPYDLIEAETAERALRVVKLGVAALVVADLTLPGMDGITFTEQVRADPRPNVGKVPVILVTGEDNDEVRARARAAGVNAFCVKPIDRKVLKDQIAELLGEPGEPD